MNFKSTGIFLNLAFSLVFVGFGNSVFAQSELPEPKDIEILKPESIAKLTSQGKQNYFRVRSDLLVNRWLVLKTEKAIENNPRQKEVLETLGDGYFESYARLAKGEYDYQIAVLKENLAETQDEREEARDKRISAKASLEMIRETLQRRYEIVLDDISHLEQIKEDDRKIIIAEKQPHQGSVAYQLTQKLLAGFLGYTKEQLLAALKKDLSVEIESGKAKSYELVTRTSKEVVSGIDKKPSTIATEGKTAEQVAEEIIKLVGAENDCRRVYVKEIGDNSVSRAWSYDYPLGLKNMPGKVIDLLAPAPEQK